MKQSENFIDIIL